jgi:hypothetical protein
MDDQRFDAITRAFASGSNRRAILRRLAVAVSGIGLTAISRRQASAAPNECAVRCADQPGARGAQCRQVCKQCAGGPPAVCLDASSGSFTCQDLQGDPKNCGGCGAVCEPPRSACLGGSCACPPETVFIEPLGICRSCADVTATCDANRPCSPGGAATTCQNGCCCVPSGSGGLGCARNVTTPAAQCCSGVCGGPEGRCL